jgi:hypothetical protein
LAKDRNANILSRPKPIPEIRTQSGAAKPQVGGPLKPVAGVGGIVSLPKEPGMAVKELWSKFYTTLASVRTGIILLLIVVIFSALGTVVLQRPATDPVEI